MIRSKFDSHRTRLCRYTSGFELRLSWAWENDEVGRASEIVSWDMRKYRCKKLINLSTSSIVDGAPNEIRATPSGFVPFSPPNSSINREINCY